MNHYPRAINRIAATLITIIMITLAAGCGASGTKQTNVIPLLPYRITGSYACLPLLRILTAEYVRKHPELRFNYLPGSSSTAAFAGIQDRTIDIGATSRVPTEPGEESPGAVQTTLSNDALVFATHTDVNIYGLTTDQVRLIYSGAITNWKDVGGPDKHIVVLDRSENETVKEILRQFCLGPTVITPTATILYSESDMNKALQMTDSSIGYLSYGGYKSQKLSLNIPSLDGITPGHKAVENKTYKITRTLGIVTNENAGPEIKAFVKWATGQEARRLMEINGYAAAN